MGVLLYEALTGVLPFRGQPLQVLLAKQHEQPRRPGELARVPEDLEALCMQLLEIDPAARRLLASVMAPPEAPPLLLLLTSRPPREAGGGGSREAALARVRALPGLRRLELAGLLRDEALALAERLFAEVAAAAAASAAAVVDEAAGHPLFIDALVRHTADRSAAPRRSGCRMRCGRGSPGSIPRRGSSSR